MRVLIVHNQYKQAGGEDFVFHAESELLTSRGHEVQQMVYNNEVIKSFLDKCESALKILYNPDSAKALRLKIQTFRPHILHVHNLLPIASPSILFVARKLGVPVIMTLHNYRLICPSATLFFKGKIYERSISSLIPMDAIWKGVYRNSVVQTALVVLMTAVHSVIGTWRNKVDCYIALTQFAKKIFEHSYLSISTHKIIVKSNFVADDGVGAKVRDNFFLFVGRITEEKGIETLIAAAGQHSFQLVVIGDGPLNKLVENSSRFNSNILFLGQQPKSVVMDYLKRCKALIFPSISHEGFPITIAEAFSTGTPVIASNFGSMKEIVQNRINGLHFKSGNDVDLVLKIKEITEDHVGAKKMCVNARLSYLNYYTPEKNYAKLMDIYATAIEQRQKQASPN